MILAMIVFSALGAAMMSYTTTSTYNQVWANSASKAYYLAESGFRYAETEYKNTNDIDNDGQIKDDRNSLLASWHDSIFTFSNQKDKFELKIYPFYLVTTASHSKGDSTLTAIFPGGQPPGYPTPLAQPPPAKLKIGNDPPYTISGYSYDSGTQIHTFTLSPVLQSNLSDMTDVYLVANPLYDGSTLIRNGYLTLSDASLFPAYNGVFRVDGGGDTVYLYKKKTNDTLENITDLSDPDRTFAVSVDTFTDIVLNPFVELHSTGIVAHGPSMETKREIVYYVPHETNAEEQTAEFQDTFDEGKKYWEEKPDGSSELGSHEVQDIGGDKALRVTDTVSLAGSPKASLIRFKWSATGVDLAVAHRLGNRFFLSYDAQVKTGYIKTEPLLPPPDWGYTPPGSSIPTYFAAGLSFRLDNTLNSFGLSFLRGSSFTAPTPDNIDDPLIPPGKDQKLLIALWQQTNSGLTPKWLAYKDISQQVHFEDDIESGVNDWTASGTPGPNGFWHISTKESHSPGNAWYYGQEGVWNYDTGLSANRGTLTSTDIHLCSVHSATLSFWSWYETEDEDYPGTANMYDVKYVDIYDGTQWLLGVYQIKYPGHPIRSWTPIRIDLSPYVGKTIKVRFRFDTGDRLYNNYEGWYIDDVTVTGDVPVNESTLLVRIVESASISFANGRVAPILEGDVVVGAVSNATGTVNGAPMVSSGSWAGNNAVGTILLANVYGTFQIGEGVTVIGSSAQAMVTGFTGRANYIRAYYGDSNGCGTPNDNPMDNEKHGNPRNTDPANVNFYWPPKDVADWAAENDYFTLVQWDAINGGVGTVARIPSLDEPDAILQSTEPVLFTPSSGLFNRAELGLHTFGKGSLNVYFDDFALRTQILSTGGFLPAIQQ